MSESITSVSLQLEAIKRGLSTVVPLKMLSLMTWRELEVHVCGRPIMDLALLKANTTYQGCSVDDEHIRYEIDNLNQ